MALTRRQKDVLDFLVKFVEDNGYSPSYEEVAAGLLRQLLHDARAVVAQRLSLVNVVDSETSTSRG